jgi:hypothetical protein
MKNALSARRQQDMEKGTRSIKPGVTADLHDADADHSIVLHFRARQSRTPYVQKCRRKHDGASTLIIVVSATAFR